MRIGKRPVIGLLTAALLIPVPAMAIQNKVAHKVISPRQTTKPGQASAVDLVQSQLAERREFLGFSQALRSQFRGGGSLTRAQVERVIRDTFKDLRAHWRLETRTKTVTSPFAFPTI